MRLEDTTWQGTFGYWKHSFIQNHLVELGCQAWRGFLHHGRGYVCCEINTHEHDPVRIPVERLPFHTYFVPQSVAKSLWQEDSEALGLWVSTLSQYEPETDLIVCVKTLTGSETFWLRQIAVPPPACGAQGDQFLDRGDST